MNGNTGVLLKRISSIMFRPAVLAGFFVFGLATSFAYAKDANAPPTEENRTEVNALLTSHLRNFINNSVRIPPSRKKGYVRAAVDAESGIVTIDLGKEYLPRNSVVEIEDFQHSLGIEAQELLRGVVQYKGLQLLFEGRDIFYYFPEEAPKPRKSATSIAPVTTGPLVVNAGHGLYYNYEGTGRWTPQREEHFGVTEDYVTPLYASELGEWLFERSGETPIYTRSYSVDLHIPSFQPWWIMGARYHLQALYPNNPEIWNSNPSSTANDRERIQDINSRPFFANHVAAHTLLSVHTNGSENVTVRGTRAYYYPGRTGDAALARNILCYMKEQIRSLWNYPTWQVEAEPAAENHAETREADMPAVLVEVAFHSNAEDADALKDENFRAAAMRGMEKGYRLHSAGMPCLTFQATSIPEVTGAHNTDIPIYVHYQGFPQFPVTARVSFVACQAGWTCTPYNKTITGPIISPMIYTVRCNAPAGTPLATFTVKTELVDADEVTAAMVQHKYTC
jgi:hypothetical protein